MNWIKEKYNFYFNILGSRNLILFGLILSGFLFAGFWYTIPFYKWGYMPLIFVQVFGVVFPRVLRSEYAFLSLLFLPVGYIVSTLVLGVAYYLIFVPLGIIRNRKYKEGWKDSVSTIDPHKMYE